MGNYRDECVRLPMNLYKGEISNWRLEEGDQHWDVNGRSFTADCSVV